MLYGLGLRPQELFGATFRQASRARFRVEQVLTKAKGAAGSSKPVGRIIVAAKTAEGVRTMTMRPWLLEELLEWRTQLENLGLPAGDDDFIIPGTAPDGHYTLEQQHNFIRDIKSCGRVAAERDPELSFLKKVRRIRCVEDTSRCGCLRARTSSGSPTSAAPLRDDPPSLPARAGRAP
jgi:hypothetical protein